MPDRRYVLKPRPPVRAFVIAAVVSLLGAVLLVITLANEWLALVGVVAGTLLVLGVVIAVLAVLLTRALATTVTLSDKGYAIESGGQPQKGRWSDVARVSQSADGSAVHIYDREGRKRRLVFSNPSDPQIDDLLSDVAQRLDDERGYTNL